MRFVLLVALALASCVSGQVTGPDEMTVQKGWKIVPHYDLDTPITKIQILGTDVLSGDKILSDKTADLYLEGRSIGTSYILMFYKDGYCTIKVNVVAEAVDPGPAVSPIEGGTKPKPPLPGAPKPQILPPSAAPPAIPKGVTPSKIKTGVNQAPFVQLPSRVYQSQTARSSNSQRVPASRTIQVTTVHTVEQSSVSKPVSYQKSPAVPTSTPAPTVYAVNPGGITKAADSGCATAGG